MGEIGNRFVELNSESEEMLVVNGFSIRYVFERSTSFLQLLALLQHD